MPAAWTKSSITGESGPFSAKTRSAASRILAWVRALRSRPTRVRWSLRPVIFFFPIGMESTRLHDAWRQVFLDGRTASTRDEGTTHFVDTSVILIRSVTVTAWVIQERRMAGPRGEPHGENLDGRLLDVDRYPRVARPARHGRGPGRRPVLPAEHRDHELRQGARRAGGGAGGRRLRCPGG